MTTVGERKVQDTPVLLEPIGGGSTVLGLENGEGPLRQIQMVDVRERNLPRRLIGGLVTSPPAYPGNDAEFIVVAPATGAFAGKANLLARWNGGEWIYTSPGEGWVAVLEGAGFAYTFVDGAWRAVTASLGPDGKIPVAQLPAVAITNSFPVANQAAMLALDAQVGDVAIRSDENKTYILAGSDPTVLLNWLWMRTPTDMVLSVAGKSGVVLLEITDIAGLTAALAAVAAATPATQADQEAGTATNVVVTPARQQYHPSAAKGWAKVAYSGGAYSLVAGYNIASVAILSTGRCRVTLTKPFSGVNAFAAIASSAGAGFTAGALNYTANSVDVSLRNGANADADNDFTIVFFGDQ